jgi:hypothetical protein
MPYSCADFASNLVNHLFNNALIPVAVAESDDLEFQANEAMAAITDIAERATASPTPATTSVTATGAAQRQARSTQFMIELLEANETLTDIAESKGAHTLADCMYLLIAIQQGGGIEVHHPTGSEILDIINDLPSAALWMTHVSEVTK